MRILAIRGKNLASLAGEFEVDFQREPLASTGLFAISGPTGAGKSTLLDALCLALFDDTPRLKTADSRGIELPDVGIETLLPNDRRNILRRGTADGYAEVDFVGNDGVAYRSRWSVRRAHSKLDRKLQSADMSLTRIEDEQPVCGHLKSEVQKAIIEKIGLSFEQFTRAVLLAQNEFFTFLKANDDDRAALLQTLTGTDRFEVLSRRAYERHKSEQDAVKSLRDRLVDQQPLSVEDRGTRESELATLQSRARAQDALVAQLGTLLRWHQDLATLVQREKEAMVQLAQAQGQHAAAATRRGHLAKIEAVQDARPLLVEVGRLEKEDARLSAVVLATQATVTQETPLQAAAQQGLSEATQALAFCEATNTQFAPRIIEARKLDTEIAALLPIHAQASQAQTAAQSARQAAQQAVVAQGTRARTVQAQLSLGQAWIAAHAPLKLLADEWPRWDTLLSHAASDAGQLVTHTQGWTALGTQHRSQLQAAHTATADLAASTRAQQPLEQTLSVAVAALKGLNAESLARDRASVEARKTALQSADQVWRERQSSTAQLAQMTGDATRVKQEITANQATLAQSRTAWSAAQGLAQQAEAAWRLVFEASQASVEALRAQLQPDTPCAVCGSIAHPYVAHDPAMDNALARLAETRDRCVKAATDLEVAGRAKALQTTNLTEQLAALETRTETLRQAQADGQSRWSGAVTALVTHYPERPFDDEAAPQPRVDNESDAVADWLADQLAAVQAATAQLTAQETELRQAAVTQQQAQSALDAWRKAHEVLQATLTRLSTEAGATESALRVVEAQVTRGRSSLEANLAQLDSAFGAQSGWREDWAAATEVFQTRCRQDVAMWVEQQRLVERSQTELANLETEAQGRAQLATKAETDFATAASAVDAAAQQLAAKQTARQQVFSEQVLPALPGGMAAPSCLDIPQMPVSDIETHLAKVLEAARQHCAEAQNALTGATQRLALAESHLGAARLQLAENATAKQAAAARLLDWLATFNARAPGDSPLTAETLADWLQCDADWLLAERQALSALDTAVATATGGLSQVASQRAAHDESRATLSAPLGCEDSPDSVETTLAQARLAAVSVQEAVTGVALMLRRDTEVRQKSAELVMAIEAAEKSAQVWAQMAHLIGSADGKKFRNYAQQMTLDVLLGYANAHLRGLARRYRLERVADSLALMVVDQDMGNDYRSVHSLSGGESFLVSLALALGLASLSSHRVRVESLFIDEGFGSLDADTLRVAMDALDHLQSMGRKIGVISHVQEMTDRIGTRIQVQKVPGGQSKIVVQGMG